MFDGTETVLSECGNLKYTFRVMFSENLNHLRPILNYTGAAESRNF